MTCFGLSTLNYNQLHQLLDPLNGYISRTPIISQPKNGKKTLVLDVDGTILNASRWIVDIRIGDLVRETQDDDKRPWTLTGFTIVVKSPDETPAVVSLKSQQEIDELCATREESAPTIVAVHISRSGQTKEIPLPQMTALFAPCIDTLEELSAYNAKRPELTPVSYLCDDLLVRFRPFLPAFLLEIRKKYNIILFTAAKKKGYLKLLKRAERCLKPMVGSAGRVFDTVLFRASCDPVGRRFRKNIAKLGVDLSQLVMIDDTAISFQGFEPNAIQVKSFYGEICDNELVGLTTCLLSMSSARDVRYALCGVKDEDVLEDDAVNMCSLEKTAQFLYDLRAAYFGTLTDEDQKSGKHAQS